MDAFWPGPLTLIFNRSSLVPDQVAAGLPTLAVRMPDHKTALALIRAAGVPIAAPSANLSGRPSPTTAQHVKADLEGRIDLILDGGPCRVGLESTVLSLCGTPTILRPGGVTRETHHPAARRGHPGNAGGGHGQRPGFQRRARPPKGGWRRPLPGHEV